MDTLSDDDSRIVIRLDRRKLALYAVGSLLFVLVGIWMFLMSDNFIHAHFHGKYGNPDFAHFFGIICAAIFFLSFILNIKKITDKKPGLEITKYGLVDNSSAIPAGFLPWSEISDVQKLTLYNAPLITLLVKNPSLYIARQQGPKKFLLKINLRFYNTPFFINPNSLKVTSANELFETLQTYKNKFSSRN